MLSYITGLRNEKRSLDVGVALATVGATNPLVHWLECPNLSDVHSTDPAARFLAANALKGLTFGSEAQILQRKLGRWHDLGRRVLYVTDFDKHR